MSARDRRRWFERQQRRARQGMTITIEFGPPKGLKLKAAFEDAVRESHSLGAVWNLGRTLAGQARKASCGAG